MGTRGRIENAVPLWELNQQAWLSANSGEKPAIAKDLPQIEAPQIHFCWGSNELERQSNACFANPFSIRIPFK